MSTSLALNLTVFCISKASRVQCSCGRADLVLGTYCLINRENKIKIAR